MKVRFQRDNVPFFLFIIIIFAITKNFSRLFTNPNPEYDLSQIFSLYYKQHRTNLFVNKKTNKHFSGWIVLKPRARNFGHPFKN